MRKEKVTLKNEGKRAIGTDGMSRLSQRTMNNPLGKVHKRKECEGMLPRLSRSVYWQLFTGLSGQLIGPIFKA